MYRDEHGLTISPTDLTKFLACRHLTTLDLAVASGTRSRPAPSPNEALELVFRKGLEHEHRYLAALQAEHQVSVIAQEDLAQAAADTERALVEGAEVIYQATFLHDGRRGHADFLLRNQRPSRLGEWSYDVADTKLARRLKVPALLQMAEYGQHLHRIQGQPPVWLTVIAGDGAEHRYRYADVECYYRRLAAEFDDFITNQQPAAARMIEHCPQCRWQQDCTQGWRAADDLSFLAFLRQDQQLKLEQAGIKTLAGLAAADPAHLPATIGRRSRQRLAGQARLQLAERRSGEPSYELLPPVASRGLLALPTPHPGDLYLDFEGDPFVEPSGREYLAGLGDRLGGFESLWAHTFTQERSLTMSLVHRLLSAWKANPGMHIYHYAPYERTALQRLTSRHGVCEAELDVLLRGEVFIDLYAVVRQGLQVSKESYSIKKMESFYWGQNPSARTGVVADAMSSVVSYEDWLISGDERVLAQILSYNQDDVRSTLALHAWLEVRRCELQAQDGQPLPRPLASTGDGEPKDSERAETELAERLLAAGHDLLAGLVGWHRREQRPAWWEVFRLEQLEDEELIEDSSAIGGLGTGHYVGDVKRSQVYRFEFPPQDTKIGIGSTAMDVDSHSSAGRVVGLDAETGWIELSVGKGRPAPQPRGLGPEGPRDDRVQRAAIAEVANRVLAGQDCLGLRLLRRVVPVGLPVAEQEPAAQAVLRLGTHLDGAVLAVQGPPGTGKSTAAATLIRALLDSGLRVGVSAMSHQVIGSLLRKVDRPGLQRCERDSHCGSDQVEWTSDNATVVSALSTGAHRLVGGTAWLWSRPELQNCVDVMVIDEAGQFCLANAVAISGAASSMVLLGDPQQLSQPSQAEHPHGAGVSVLEHLLTGRATVAAERGVFLDQTWRMHPAITEFVSVTCYDGRLRSAAGLARQAVSGSLHWDGSGLDWLPVSHTGNNSASTEEAQAVAQIVTELLAARWIDAEGISHPLRHADILVVAAYNAQVAQLREHLDPDIAVGTVDKFQGREAAVVVYSLASSSADEAPRGVDFLYDLHRLNVAVSRARAKTILVGSPALLNPSVHTPAQLQRVNALCRFVELAARQPRRVVSDGESGRVDGGGLL